MRRASLDEVHALANDPRIFPAIASTATQHFDLTDGWHDVLALSFDGGAVVFHLGEPVEVHMLFLPRGRAINGAREALHFLFATTDAREVLARIPDDLRHCQHAAVVAGFVRTGATESIERTTGPVNVTHYHLTRDAWEHRSGTDA